MPITISIADTTATIDDSGHWTSEREGVADYLNECFPIERASHHAPYAPGAVVDMLLADPVIGATAKVISRNIPDIPPLPDGAIS